MDNTVDQHFEFAAALRGFHVYKSTEKWRPVKGQELTFHSDFDNDFDRFAVAGKTLARETSSLYSWTSPT